MHLPQINLASREGYEFYLLPLRSRFLFGFCCRGILCFSVGTIQRIGTILDFAGPKLTVLWELFSQAVLETKNANAKDLRANLKTVSILRI